MYVSKHIHQIDVRAYIALDLEKIVQNLDELKKLVKTEVSKADGVGNFPTMAQISEMKSV